MSTGILYHALELQGYEITGETHSDDGGTFHKENSCRVFLSTGFLWPEFLEALPVAFCNAKKDAIAQTGATDSKLAQFEMF